MRIHEPPEHLSDAAAALWRQTVETFDLDEANLIVLQVACESFDRLQEARARIAKDGGIVVTDPSGRVRAHPALSVEKEARTGFLRAWRQLRLDVEPPGPMGRPPGR